MPAKKLPDVAVTTTEFNSFVGRAKLGAIKTKIKSGNTTRTQYQLERVGMGWGRDFSKTAGRSNS